MSDPQIRLTGLLARAAQSAETSLNRSLSAVSAIRVLRDDPFTAKVAPNGPGCLISLSESVITRFDALWTFLLETPALTSGVDFHRSPAFETLAGSVAGCTDLSLEWLILHELMHVELGHLTRTGRAGLVEAGPRDGAQSQALTNIETADLPIEDEALVSRCFEMQADSEASDIFLGPFDKNRWDDLRVLAVAAFAVMAVMESENVQRGARNVSHPSAGVRFFTLLGHLFQMWLYPTAYLEKADVGSILRTPERPDTDEFNAYAQTVLVPLINDAVMVAMAAEARSFLIDIGDQGKLLKDLFTIQYGEVLNDETLLTNAAREWLELIPANEKLMTAAGYRP